MLLNYARTKVKKGSYVNFTANEVNGDSSILLSLGGQWQTEHNSEFSVTENVATNGFSILFFSTAISVDGFVIVANNNVSDFGALNVINTKVDFNGGL